VDAGVGGRGWGDGWGAGVGIEQVLAADGVLHGGEGAAQFLEQDNTRMREYANARMMEMLSVARDVRKDVRILVGTSSSEESPAPRIGRGSKARSCAARKRYERLLCNSLNEQE
jgi:hypothetical protein